ncbi:histidine phosphatase family protein [Hoeflea prorocentri]|uniref:Histidine phosphatase family protein n=1 Tax=Hoeflea prorocentri TaxID=1922333 RepID=A0A9X3ULR6_9HYPH|nr:histidine phosphatase family protein [Hoeflea prorocentri]MCY6383567.1 histidine phosphatase family protein [Hoeflea prorocentri]MDA5401367.1 histidine phosphatase family protein [Hoeflea prorocentri]
MKRRPLALVATVLLICGFAVSGAKATEAAWARLASGGYTILLTHALAPGVGDPPFFELGDCATQRNLSDRGRQQARRRGVRFAARAVSISTVYSSQWCRTLETAENAFRDVDAQLLEALDLVEDDPETLEAKNAEVMEIIRAFRGPGNQVMMTHPENVEALTGITPREGEAVIVAPSRDDPQTLDVVARLLLD